MHSSISVCSARHALRPEPIVERQLRLLPCALRFGALLAACLGHFNEPAALILPGALREPALRDQRLQVAGQRRRVELHGGRQLAGPDRPEQHHMRQQRVLRVLQAGGRDIGVVVAASRSRQLPQLEVGAAARGGKRRQGRGADRLSSMSIIVATILVSCKEIDTIGVPMTRGHPRRLASPRSRGPRASRPEQRPRPARALRRPHRHGVLPRHACRRDRASADLHTLDFRLVEASRAAWVPGQAAVRALQPARHVHGGWIATLLDSAVACAVHSRCRQARSTRRSS